MATEVILEKMGQTVEACNIVRWLKAEGEPVQKGEPLYEVETDKATFEAEAPASGILRHVRFPAGSTDVPVLSVLALIAAEGEELPPPEGGSAEPASKPSPAAAATPPPQKSAEAAPLDTDSPALHRRPDGRLKLFITPRARQVAAQQGMADEAALAQIPGRGPQGRIEAQDVLDYLAQQQAEPAIPVSPVAQRRAQEAGLDLARVSGSGPGGRISKEDVEKAIAALQRPAEPAPAPEALAGLSGVRRVIAQRMRASLDTAAHVTLTTEADATELVALRNLLVADLESVGVRPTYNDLLIRIAARALREQPHINVSLGDGGIVQHDAVHVGLAVDTERGLLVPVVRDADRKGLVEIARETQALAEKARAGQLLPDEMQGGTFTLTNLGMYEVDAFTPIINLPQSAILGVGRILARPWVYEEELAVRQIVVLSFSFDHRLVDGAPAARFLQRIKHLIEKPHLMWG